MHENKMVSGVICDVVCVGVCGVVVCDDVEDGDDDDNADEGDDDDEMYGQGRGCGDGNESNVCGGR